MWHGWVGLVRKEKDCSGEGGIRQDGGWVRQEGGVSCRKVGLVGRRWD